MGADFGTHFFLLPDDLKSMIPDSLNSLPHVSMSLLEKTISLGQPHWGTTQRRGLEG